MALKPCPGRQVNVRSEGIRELGPHLSTASFWSQATLAPA